MATKIVEQHAAQTPCLEQASLDLCFAKSIIELIEVSIFERADEMEKDAIACALVHIGQAKARIDALNERRSDAVANDARASH